MAHRVQIASLLFGLGSWITITGFWAELPLLTHYLPEKWRLSSQLTLAIQLANIGPLIYCLLKGRFTWCNDVTATHGQMVIGVASCLLLIFAWDVTVTLWDERRSLFLMTAAFGLSLLDCTSSVTFLPFMARFNDRHLTPYLIGEGLSGFIPIVVAMIQGSVDGMCSDGNSTDSASLLTGIRFEPPIFFLSLLITLMISWIAFIWLLTSPIAAKEHVEKSDIHERQSMVEGKPVKEFTAEPGNEVSENEYNFLQIIIVYACLSTFGIFPSLQPYSTLPYGNWALLYTVLGTGLAYPIGCSIAMITDVTSVTAITALTVTGSLISVYLFICATMSPFPLLISSPTAGGYLSVSCWISYILILSYVKTIVTLRMSRARGENALYRVGIYTQIGSVVGAAFMFLAVNYFSWFQESVSDC